MTDARADGPHPFAPSLAQRPSPTSHAWRSPEQAGADLLRGDTRTDLSTIPAPLPVFARLAGAQLCWTRKGAHPTLARHVAPEVTVGWTRDGGANGRPNQAPPGPAYAVFAERRMPPERAWI